MKALPKNAEFFIGQIMLSNSEAALALMRIIDDLKNSIEYIKATAVQHFPDDTQALHALKVEIPAECERILGG